MRKEGKRGKERGRGEGEGRKAEKNKIKLKKLLKTQVFVKNKLFSSFLLFSSLPLLSSIFLSHFLSFPSIHTHFLSRPLSSLSSPSFPLIPSLSFNLEIFLLIFSPSYPSFPLFKNV